MAKVLLTWELGGGLSHMARLGEIGKGLVQRGLQVYAAIRDLRYVDQVFGAADIKATLCPVKEHVGGHQRQILSYAHLLRNIGFESVEELLPRANAWRSLFEALAPDLIVFEHSPTALLAARNLPVKRVLVGSGFTIPPNVSPLPVIRQSPGFGAEQLASDERAILNQANAVLSDWGEPQLSSLSQLYYPNQGAFLSTFPELDAFGFRDDVRYLGVVPFGGGDKPEWPSRHGKKVFVYLKPFKYLELLLQVLKGFPVQSLVYAPDVNQSLKEQYDSSSMRFVSYPVDMELVAEQCDVAIFNGTNSCIGQMMRAGKPTLNIPLVLEQVYNARAAERLGIGLTAAPDRPAEITARLGDLVHSPDLQNNARQAAKQAPLIEDPIAGMLEVLVGLLS